MTNKLPVLFGGKLIMFLVVLILVDFFVNSWSGFRGNSANRNIDVPKVNQVELGGDGETKLRGNYFAIKTAQVSAAEVEPQSEESDFSGPQLESSTLLKIEDGTVELIGVGALHTKKFAVIREITSGGTRVVKLIEGETMHGVLLAGVHDDYVWLESQDKSVRDESMQLYVFNYKSLISGNEQ